MLMNIRKSPPPRLRTPLEALIGVVEASSEISDGLGPDYAMINDGKGDGYGRIPSILRRSGVIPMMPTMEITQV